ncbi:unnamed protein product [Protopolystoma xenopodis]|uniref:Uncharacterized protein n=1 Tax=Protopolystoma xenopodis TaxID=117903 RepID=A0A448X2Y5_9PLAT|nr:unnamed protein product [Protopolystoma xenopodis]
MWTLLGVDEQNAEFRRFIEASKVNVVLKPVVKTARQAAILEVRWSHFSTAFTPKFAITCIFPDGHDEATVQCNYGNLQDRHTFDIGFDYQPGLELLAQVAET